MSLQTNDLEVMTNIIKLLKQFSTNQDEQDNSFYNAVFYLFKNEIYKFPRNIIIFYIFASYDISLKVQELENKIKILELIFDIYNKIQTKESIPLPPILHEFAETIPNHEFNFKDFSIYFNKGIMIAESDLLYFLNDSFSVRNPYDYIKEYISIIVNWMYDQMIETNNYQIVFDQLYEETKELMGKFQQNPFYFIERPEIVAIVSISIACENLQINIEKIFGSNQNHFFFDFLLPNCNKETSLKN